MHFKRSFSNFLVWRNRNVQDQHFLIFLAFIIGLTTSIATWMLKTLIELMEDRVKYLSIGHGYLYLIFPVVGILIAGLYVRYIVKEDIGHGVTKILYAISQRKSYIKLHNIYTSIIASSITIGFGGSVGAEAPIVLTGAAIGSNLGRAFRLEPKHLMLLIGCGAAGAIAGIFKAPFAGFIFVIEVLMLDLTMSTIIPLLTAAITAASFSYVVNGTDPMFRFAQHTFEMKGIPYVILLGLFCGLVSLYFTRAMSKFESGLKKFNYWQKFAICGAILSVLIFILRPLYGEGYSTIGILLGEGSTGASLLDGTLFTHFADFKWAIIVFIGAVALFKVFASSATNGGGGAGGIFAPSLFLGCLAGFVFASTSNNIGILPVLSPASYALLGMAGVMAGVMHAPLTGTFLIVELTGGYELFLPLMIVSVVAYVTIKFFEPHSIYAIRLAKKGELITHQKDNAVLTLMTLNNLIEKEFQSVTPNMTLGDMVKVVSQCSRNVFPVIDEDRKLIGIVLLDNIRNIMFRSELYDRFKVIRFMVSPPGVIVVNMTMSRIMALFDETKAWNLPVIDENNIYLGFISKSNILNAYREVLVENFSEA